MKSTLGHYPATVHGGKERQRRLHYINCTTHFYNRCSVVFLVFFFAMFHSRIVSQGVFHPCLVFVQALPYINLIITENFFTLVSFIFCVLQARKHSKRSQYSGIAFCVHMCTWSNIVYTHVLVYDFLVQITYILFSVWQCCSCQWLQLMLKVCTKCGTRKLFVSNQNTRIQDQYVQECKNTIYSQVPRKKSHHTIHCCRRGGSSVQPEGAHYLHKE